METVMSREVPLDGGDVADVHARINRAAVHGARVAWCAVWVYPRTENGPTMHAKAPTVPGYWYEPTALEARALLVRLRVLS